MCYIVFVQQISLSTQYIPGAVPNAGDTGMYSLVKFWPFMEFTFQWERDKQQANK